MLTFGDLSNSIFWHSKPARTPLRLIVDVLPTMATNGLLSSDDELFFDPMPTEEPTTYEFQSELSDDEDPDPIAVDEITQPVAPSVPSHLMPAMPRANMDDFFPDDSMQYEEPPVTNGHGYDGHPSDRDDSAGPVTRIVDIEVALPEMSEEKKAEFEYIEVPEMKPETEGYMTRRTRNGVRGCAG